MGVCKKCGLDLAEGQGFCPNCGTPIGETPIAESTSQTFSFFKKKMIGNLTYKRTTTKITISDNQIDLTQTLNRLFRKEKNIQKSFTVASVTSVKIHTVMDFWDSLYTIIFGTLGFFQPAAFLIALVCLWCAYGKEMELILSDNEKVKIPYSGTKKEAKKFSMICQK